MVVDDPNEKPPPVEGVVVDAPPPRENPVLAGVVVVAPPPNKLPPAAGAAVDVAGVCVVPNPPNPPVVLPPPLKKTCIRVIINDISRQHTESTKSTSCWFISSCCCWRTESTRCCCSLCTAK